MAAKIDITTPAPPPGAPLRPKRGKNRHCESFTLTTLGDGHAVPSIFAATPAGSTKVEKLMDTLSDPIRIGILSGTRAKDLSVPCSEDHSRVTNHYSRLTNYLDTPVEIKSGLTAAESATSSKTSRYTFDMSGKGDFRA